MKYILIFLLTLSFGCATNMQEIKKSAPDAYRFKCKRSVQDAGAVKCERLLFRGV